MYYLIKNDFWNNYSLGDCLGIISNKISNFKKFIKYIIFVRKCFRVRFTVILKNVFNFFNTWIFLSFKY